MTNILEYWPIITGVAGVYIAFLVMLVRLIWVFSKMRMEIQVVLTNLETRMEGAEKKVETLFNLHNKG